MGKNSKKNKQWQKQHHQHHRYPVCRLANQLGTHRSRIPLNIFTHILYLSLHVTPFGTNQDPAESKHSPFRSWSPVFLARVCRAWKDVVFATPFLWTHWNLHVCPSLHGIRQMLRVTAKNAPYSRGLPLTVQIAFGWETKFGLARYQDDECTGYGSMCNGDGSVLIAEFLHKHCHRFQHLSFVGPGRAFQNLGYAAKQASFSFDMPLLQTFEVFDFDPTPPDHGDYSDGPKDPLIITPGPTFTGLVLDMVELGNKFLLKPDAFNRITNLCLRQPDYMWTLYVLSLSPQVERVELLCVWGSGPNDLVPETFINETRPRKIKARLPNLRIFDFSSEDQRFKPDVLATMFSRLDMPKLTHLRWVFLRDWRRLARDVHLAAEHEACKKVHFEIVGDLVARSAGTLRLLVLGHYHVTKRVLEDLHAKVRSRKSAARLTVLGCKAPEEPKYEGDYPTRTLKTFARWPFSLYDGPRESTRRDFYRDADCIVPDPFA